MILLWLPLVLIPEVHTQQDCGRSITVHPIDTSPRNGVQSMAQSFLDKVGTHISLEDVKSVIDDVTGGHAEKALDKVWPLVKKQRGFTGCFVVGILLIVFLPIAFLLVALLRCLCNACGAKREQDRPRCSEFSFFAAGLLICLGFWVGSIVCYVQNSSEVWPRVKTIRNGASSQIEKTSEFVENLNKEGHCLSDFEISKVRASIGDVIDTVPDYMSDAFGDTMPFDKINELFDALNDSISTQEKLVSTMNIFISSVEKAYESCSDLFGQLAVQIGKWKERNKTSEDPDKFKEYNVISVKEETILVKGLSGSVGPLKTAIEAEKKSLEKREQLHSAQEKISDMGKSTAAKANETAEKHLGEAAKKLNDAMRKIDEQVAKFTKILADVRLKIDTTMSEKNIHDFDWAKELINVFVLPAAIILAGLLVTCLYGACGCSLSVKPSERGFLSNCAGLTLVFTAYITFLLGILIVVFTFLLFFVGYSSEALLCRPLFHHPDPKYLDFLSWLAKRHLKTDKVDLNMSRILNDCQANKGISVALRLEMPEFEIPEIRIENPAEMDVSSLMEPIMGLAGDTDLVKSLKSLEELVLRPRKTGENLRDSAKVLDGIDSSIESHSKTKKQLKKASSEYKKFEDQIKGFLRQSDAVNKSMTKVSDLAQEILGELDALQSDEGPSKEKFKAITDKIQEEIKTKLSAVVDEVFSRLKNVGKCRPLHTIYLNIGRLFCGYVVDPVNGMWFSIGIGLFATIPTIAFSFLLSKYCLKMSPPSV